MDPNQEGQSNAGAPSAPNSGAPGTPTEGVPPAPAPGAITPGTPSPAPGVPTPAATPQPGAPVFSAAGRRRPGSPVQAGQSTQPVSNMGINSANPTPGIIASNPAPTGAAGGKKLSKGMIIGIAIIAILAVVAVVVGIISATGGNKNNSSSNSTSSAPVDMGSLETAYNNLANYIVFGNENTSEGKLDGKTYDTEEMLDKAIEWSQTEPILEADIMLTKENSAQKGEYFQNFRQLFSQLPNNIYAKYAVSVGTIYNYYNSFSTIGVIPDTEVISHYEVEGLESTRSYIENTITTDSDQEEAKQYANALRDYKLALLNLVNDIEVNSRCKVNIENTNNCNLAAAASYENYRTALTNIQSGEAYDIKAEFQRAALQALLNIKDIINGKIKEVGQ